MWDSNIRETDTQGKYTMGVENNITFGAGTFYINDTPVNGAIGAMEVAEFPKNRYLKAAAFTTAFTAEFEGEVNAPLLSELAELDSNPTFQMEYDGVVYEQVRKHKKKRINKKWAKRYGYREVPCHTVLENAHLMIDSSAGFVIMSDCPKTRRKRG